VSEARDLCECEMHGAQRETFVCAHIPPRIDHGVDCGFVCYPGPDDDGLTDAWCFDCEVFLNANGGEWTDEVKVPDGLSILCAQCYLRARKIADEHSRLRVN